MLQIKNLTIECRRDLRVILENFNLALYTGEKAIIIGKEGNGRSTLLKWIFDPALAARFRLSPNFFYGEQHMDTLSGGCYQHFPRQKVYRQGLHACVASDRNGTGLCA